MSFERCIRESRNDRSLTRPPLQNQNEHITAPEDAMQIVLVPELPPFVAMKTLWQPWMRFPLFISIPDIKSGPQNNC